MNFLKSVLNLCKLLLYCRSFYDLKEDLLAFESIFLILFIQYLWWTQLVAYQIASLPSSLN